MTITKMLRKGFLKDYVCHGKCHGMLYVCSMLPSAGESYLLQHKCSSNWSGTMRGRSADPIHLKKK